MSPIAPLPQVGADSCIPRSQCCKVCSRGKARGNSCISRSYTCRKGRGCACEGPGRPESDEPEEPSRSPPDDSKNDFKTIVRRLDRQLGQVREHVGTHVGENDAFAVEFRAVLHER